MATLARILVPRLRAVLGLVGSAQATTLVSPNVSVTNVDNSLLCRLVNAGKETIAVHFELLDGGGQVLLEDDTAAAASCRS